MATRTRSITKEDWLQAVHQAGGVIGSIAEILKINRSTIHRKAKSNQWLAEAIAKAQEDCKDIAERNIRSMLEKGNAKVTMWYLDRKAKDRGFGNSVNVDAKVEQSGQLHLYLPDDGRDVGEPDGNRVA